jgi:hypothetical protein
MKDNVIEEVKEILRWIDKDECECEYWWRPTSTWVEFWKEKLELVIKAIEKHLPTSEKVIKCPECGISIKYACDCAVKSMCN